MGKYEEALEKARQLCVLPTDRAILEEIFPELKEGEDERIRKEMIEILKEEVHNFPSSVIANKSKSWIAWLEKQSKASKVEQAMREVEEKAEAFTEAHKGETSEEILAQMRGEQKPVLSEVERVTIEFINECLTTIKEVAIEADELNTEFTIEQKAKRYDEKLDVARHIYADPSVKDEDKYYIEVIFPELKESEDEKTRRSLISFLKSPFVNENITDEKVTPWIAWLEKQGEHANFCNKIQIGDKVTRNRDGVLVNLSQLNRVAKKDEKQGE